MDILFDMETGDPDDLITLLLLLNNSNITLRGITCYQGSAVQIGLIKHVVDLSSYSKDSILIGGSNTLEPSQLSTYYTDVIGQWDNKIAIFSPVDVFREVFSLYPNTHVLTGAPLTNLDCILQNLPDLKIKHMTTQGGYLGNLVTPHKQLSKFKGRNSFRTYNLGNDLKAFEHINSSQQIENLTYVTKDLCHGFVYTSEIHNKIQFSPSPIGELLKKCLARYADSGKNKAMHDPLAMIVMLNPSLGQDISINMKYHIDDRGHPVFSSFYGNGSRKGIIDYNQDFAWSNFIQLCEENKLQNFFEPKISF